MKQFLITIEESEHPGEHPFYATINKINIDPKGYQVSEVAAKTLLALCRKIGEELPKY